MLYDWKRQSLTNANLIAWLEAQRSEDRYNWTDNCACPLAQYFSACGYQEPVVGILNFAHGVGSERWGSSVALPAGWNSVMLTAPWTFGAALARARALEATAMQHSADTEKAGERQEAGSGSPVNYY